MIDYFEFYKGKRVFITGHNGFKGSWLCMILSYFGAKVQGYSLEAKSTNILFSNVNKMGSISSYNGDVRNLEYLKRSIYEFQPEIVFHLAAQPIVRESYVNPVLTYETNIMGTVNLLDSVRHCTSIKSVVIITTDKVYKNMEWNWGYRENDLLNGFDPYSNSKSCAELVTDSYINSFFSREGIAVSTDRAGNVIGGGDFSTDRIIPDCIKAIQNSKPILVRNPNSIRPYQHVIEPLFAYLILAKKQFEDGQIASSYNIGPDDIDCVSTRNLVELFCAFWGNGATWEILNIQGPHESNFLKLDSSKAKSKLSWYPKWRISTSVQKTIEWYKCYLNGDDLTNCMLDQIKLYLLS